jgi:L-aminopeptidase/D-esterase-like protein
MKAGIGTASIKVAGFTVGAIVAVNAVGDVLDPATGRLVAGAREPGTRVLRGSTRTLLDGQAQRRGYRRRCGDDHRHRGL